MNLGNKELSEYEKERIGRNVVIWLNTFPALPSNIADGLIQYESLSAKEPSMATATIQGTYITDRDILGRREARYQFKVIYRIRPGGSMDAKLKADELLNGLGVWAAKQTPYIGDDKQVVSVNFDSQSALFAAYDNGDEDHQILMSIDYQEE